MIYFCLKESLEAIYAAAMWYPELIPEISSSIQGQANIKLERNKNSYEKIFSALIFVLAQFTLTNNSLI